LSTPGIGLVIRFQSVSESKLFDHLYEESAEDEITPVYHIPSGHVYIFQVLIVLSGFDDEDFDIWILGKTACDYTARGASSGNCELMNEWYLGDILTRI
jgi:hypothetical protein